jgi:hypothetical protein
MISFLARFDFAPHGSGESIVVASLQPYLLHAHEYTRRLMKCEEGHAKSAFSDPSHYFVALLSGFFGWER